MSDSSDSIFAHEETLTEIDSSGKLTGRTCKTGKLNRGLTKRELFAGLAMQGLISTNTHVGVDSVARVAINYADALIQELSL